MACLLAVLGTAAPASASTFGIDWGWGAPSTASQHAHHVRFGASYLSYDRSKNWTAAEIHREHRAGIPTVVVWETTANRALDGCAAGRSDALEAARQAKALGEPKSRPIFFAVDFDTTGQVWRIKPYFRCVDHALGVKRVGAYGGFSTIQGLRGRENLITYGWQTYAWSYGRWGWAALQQYSNDGHYIGGVSVDYDRAFGRDYGQWPLPKPKRRHHKPHHHPKPKPTPKPTPKKVCHRPRVLKRGDHGLDVRHVQRALHQHPSGTFDRKLAGAVARLQRRHHLRPTGQVNSRVRRLLHLRTCV